MTNLEKIKTDIINDPDNLKFKKLGYVPIYYVSANTEILIIGQAPGIKTQLKGEVFRDKSGDTLREWLNVSEDTFYNSDNFGVLPLDFFYPGKGKSGDLPPRKNFYLKWHPLILKELKNLKLIILIGNYALKAYLGNSYLNNLTETVKNYKNYLPKYFPLVHPSPLNFRWHNKNPWFMKEVIPELRKIVNQIIKK